MTQLQAPKLSICIATFNRADFIGETLKVIISQATRDCEIVVSDNASTDSTEQVVSECARQFERLRYFRQDTNKGLDRNFDCAVKVARGEYCWLMTDDDLLRAGAIARVLQALSRDLSLIIVNMELRDVSMSNVLQRRWIDFESDRLYGPGESDRLFEELDGTLVNIGNVVVKRAIWLERERERYYGSLFIHVGIIFQEPLPGEALVIATPLINYRLGNAQTFSSMWTEIFLSKWPSLVDSLALSDFTREKIRSVKPWKNLSLLLFLRGTGYTLLEYRRWIRPRLKSKHERWAPILVALLPCVLAKALGVVNQLVNRDGARFLRSTRQS